MTIIYNNSRTQAVKITTPADGGFYATHVYNLTDDIHSGGQVAAMKFFTTEAGAKRWATKKVAA